MTVEKVAVTIASGSLAIAGSLFSGSTAFQSTGISQPLARACRRSSPPSSFRSHSTLPDSTMALSLGRLTGAVARTLMPVSLVNGSS